MVSPQIFYGKLMNENRWIKFECHERPQTLYDVFRCLGEKTDALLLDDVKRNSEIRRRIAPEMFCALWSGTFKDSSLLSILEEYHKLVTEEKKSTLSKVFDKDMSKNRKEYLDRIRQQLELPEICAEYLRKTEDLGYKTALAIGVSQSTNVYIWEIACKDRDIIVSKDQYYDATNQKTFHILSNEKHFQNLTEVIGDTPIIQSTPVTATYAVARHHRVTVLFFNGVEIEPEDFIITKSLTVPTNRYKVPKKINDAVIELNRGNYEKCIIDLNMFAKENDKKMDDLGKSVHMLIQFFLAVAYQRAENLQEAWKCIQKAIDQFYQIRESYTEKNIPYVNLRDFNEIMSTYARGIPLMAGYILYGMARYFEAQKQMQKVIDMDLNDLSQQDRNYFLTMAYNTIGSIRNKEKNFTDAESAYHQALTKSPNEAGVFANIGVLKYHLLNLSESLVSFEKAIDFDPSNSLYHASRSMVLMRMSKFEEAESAMSSAVDFAQKQPARLSHESRYKYYLARSQMHTNHVDHAIKYLREELYSHPENYQATLHLAQALVIKGEYEDAIKIINESIDKTAYISIKFELLIHSLSAHMYLNNLISSFDLLEQIMIIVEAEPSRICSKQRACLCLNLCEIYVGCYFLEEAKNVTNLAMYYCTDEDIVDECNFWLGNIHFDLKEFDKAAQYYEKCVNRITFVGEYLEETKLQLLSLKDGNVDTYKSHCSAAFDVYHKISDSDEKKLKQNMDKQALDSKDLEKTSMTALEDGQWIYHSNEPDDVKHGNRIFELVEDGGIWYRKKLHPNATKRKATGYLMYDFIVEIETSRIFFGRVGHLKLAKGKDVSYAGNICFVDGFITMWNNCSGHYKPYPLPPEDVSKKTKLPLDKYIARHILKQRLQILVNKCTQKDTIRYLTPYTGANKKLTESLIKQTTDCKRQVRYKRNGVGKHDDQDDS